jgi:hypothetical protein
MNKLCYPILLPTKKGIDSNLFFHSGIGTNQSTLCFTTQGKVHREEMLACGVNIPQHLYICNDEEIKEGDWHIVRGTSIRKASCVNDRFVTSVNEIGGVELHNPIDCLKVIASTDVNLKLTK